MRDAAHIYGLPSNERKAQEEADKGTLMAVQSGWIHEEQVKVARRRMVPPVSTLENPPGDDQAGSAWLLPEMQEALACTKSYEVQFNTCAYQSKLKERWFKPAQWAGKLEGLERLRRKCNCPRWARHITLMGKAKTEAAGEYPEELATEVAKLIVMTWKRVLGLEWWRHKVATSEEEVSQYSKKWLEAEKNRVSCPGKKRSWTVAFEEPREESKEGLEKEEREERPKRKVTSRAFEGANNPNDSMPDASGQPSKKARREGQDDFSVGGMRHPKKAVDRLHLLKSCGMHVRNRWELFYMRNPSARQVAKDYGTKDAEIDPEVLEAWKKQLEEEFATGPEEEQEKTVKLAFEFKSPLKAHLWEGWQRKSRDPDKHLASFIRHGVALGMSLPVPSSGGVFPPADPAKRSRLEEDVEFEDARGTKNYSSVTAQQGEATIEIDRYLKKGFVRRMSWDGVEALWLRHGFKDGLASQREA